MSSRIRINRLPLRNAARAIRAVSSGTGSIGDGRIDIGSLLQGVPCLNTPISTNDQQYLYWLVRHSAGGRSSSLDHDGLSKRRAVIFSITSSVQSTTLP